MKQICDLHTHSVYSDGTYTPTEIICSAIDIGLSAVALCDHNTVDGIPEFFAAAKGKNIEAIAGSEFSVDYNGNEHRVYARNVGADGNTDQVGATYSVVTLPDGTEATVQYSITGRYFNNEIEGTYQLGLGTNNNYAVNAGEYVVTAQIKDHTNYNNWPSVDGEVKANLVINKATVNVNWRYANSHTPDYTYNGEDQTSTLEAYILRLGQVDENQTIALNVDVLLENQNVNEAIRKYFALAGQYDNNYNLVEAEKQIEIKKFTLTLKWLYACDGCGKNEVEYDASQPCVYDKTKHGVVAKGLGLLDREMSLTTSGTFSAINANNYVASVQAIAEGYDTILIEETSYSVSYSTNYQLPDNTNFSWQIKQRAVSLTFDVVNSYLSKAYDNSDLFVIPDTFESTSSKAQDGTVVKTNTYIFNEKNYDQKDNKVVYSLSNIINGDEAFVNIAITSATANRKRCSIMQGGGW